MLMMMMMIMMTIVIIMCYGLRCCRHLSYFAGQPCPVTSVLDLWQVVMYSTSSTQINLVDVLRRLSLFDVADAVQHELDLCRYRQRHPVTQSQHNHTALSL